MTTTLLDYTDSLRREITPLGSDEFSNVGDIELADHLGDAFWEARLDGFMRGWRIDLNGTITREDGSPGDFPREKIALIVTYAAVRILRLRIMNTEAHFKASAGPVEFETRQSAEVMRELLRQLQWRKEKLLEAMEATDVSLIDALTVRTLSPGSYGGWADYPVSY